MAINSNLLVSGMSIPRPSKATRGPNKKTANPIASRDWKQIEFVRQSLPSDADLEKIDEMQALIAAWKRSPNQTIVGMLTNGYTADEIGKKFGFPDNDPTFKELLSNAQQWFKRRIANEQLEALPDSLIRNVVDSDGVTQQIDIADKLKKAVTAALFNQKSDKITFSIVKNVPFYLTVDAAGKPVIPTLGDIFQISADEVSKKKRYAHEAYGKVFRTRNTSIGEDRAAALPPALARFAAALESVETLSAGAEAEAEAAE